MRFLYLLASSLLVTSAAQAQLSLRAGGSLTKLHTTTGTNLYNTSEAKLGYQVGLAYQVPLTKWLSVVPEVQYSNERTTLAQANYSIPDVGFSADTRLNLHYLNVPAMVRAALGPVYVEVGAQGSFLLGGRQTGTATTTGWMVSSVTRDVDQRVTDANRRFDVGPCAGIGVQLPAGLGISVRAYRGLVTLNHERSNLDGEYRRQSLQASLTYQLARR